MKVDQELLDKMQEVLKTMTLPPDIANGITVIDPKAFTEGLQKAMETFPQEMEVAIKKVNND